MARAARLIDTIKQQLRLQSINYRQLAEKLDLSESAVKQMFAGGNMSLKRLDAICDVLGLELTDLAAIAETEEDKLAQLTQEQERELVDDLKFLLVGYCVVNHWRFEEIIEHFDVTETECIQYLARLDRMKLIELLPGNRIKPLIAPNFKWQPGGPIDQFFRREVQAKFFASRFDGNEASRVIRNGYLSEEVVHHLIDRIDQVGDGFDQAVWNERKTSADRRFGVTMVLAIRKWEFAIFEQFARKNQGSG